MARPTHTGPIHLSAAADASSAAQIVYWSEAKQARIPPDSRDSN